MSQDRVRAKNFHCNTIVTDLTLLLFAGLISSIDSKNLGITEVGDNPLSCSHIIYIVTLGAMPLSLGIVLSPLEHFAPLLYIVLIIRTLSGNARQLLCQ